MASQRNTSWRLLAQAAACGILTGLLSVVVASSFLDGPEITGIAPRACATDVDAGPCRALTDKVAGGWEKAPTSSMIVAAATFHKLSDF
jgi:hypothetical protein